MKKYEFDIQGDYGQGWETETTEETLKDAKERLKEYNINCPQYPHRIKKVVAE